MNTDFLRRLYWARADEERHMEEGLNLGELYQRTEATRTANHAFSDALFAPVGANLEDGIENLYNDACQAHEEQGFINGFRLGMKLAGELGLCREAEAAHDERRETNVGD